MTVLELKDVTVRSRENGDLILKGVSLKLEARQKTLIRGPSGSGKTTLFHAILGGLPTESGEILFKNEPVTRFNIRDVRTQIAAISQEPVLGAGKVREGLLLPFTFKERCGKSPSEERISEVFSELGLDPELLNQAVPELSGGEKQRVAIARALLLESEVFLLDEVTSALDPENRDRVIQALSSPRYTVLAISHDLSWENNFDDILTLKEGRLSRESERAR